MWVTGTPLISSSPHLLISSPLPLLLQQVGEVVALVHVVHVFAFLGVQLVDRASVALFSQQQLTEHPSVRFLVLLLQAIKLRSAVKIVRL